MHKKFEKFWNWKRFNGFCHLGPLSTRNSNKSKFLKGTASVHIFCQKTKQILNYIKLETIKFTNSMQATKLIVPNCFMIVINLKNGYFLIRVHYKSRKHLRFMFQKQCYEFTYISFGFFFSALVIFPNNTTCSTSFTFTWCELCNLFESPHHLRRDIAITKLDLQWTFSKD